ncbi:coq1 putative hexaprenyl diphosphate synthase [Apiotrichum porosum]|uniref:(2E,6E)-farnesyl diphosphate synthase n=1 Tax=Apiotrichum porosum TaxID=105984 RepID=A0A427XGY0_9TREE|nr:coq1 putative hexaprenyl diphosphate synthase [Apiotrichum porosum]RSH78155.1 coq1 putative hexaprenyl diphosphate synthase [Apiotrichum porosum]
MLSRAAKAACRKTVYATSVSSAARRSAAAIAVRNTHSSAPHSSAAAAAVASSSTWAAATESAHSVLVQPAGPSKQQLNLDDPLAAITAEIGELKHSLFHMLGSSSPALDSVAKYYFNAEGKHLRPLLVLLMSQATNGIAGPGWAAVEAQAREQLRSRSGGVDNALTSDGGVLNDWNPESMGAEKGGEMVFASPYRIPAEGQQRPLPPAVKQNPFAELLPTGGPGSPTILPTQRRLASIVEMIHVASLLHDDVVDASDLRRGEPSAPAAFGNKLSILSGDFLLGRASVALSRLGSGEVVELMATTIANLIEGEVLQLRATANPATEPTAAGFEEYMRKTYLKTASLMAKSARSAVLLGGCTANETAWVKDVAYGYGRNLGIAFQLVDDMLDYLPASADLGKPGSGADLRLGLATAPALFAWEEFPELGPLIMRKFEGPGDTEVALDLVGRSRGMQRTADLARTFASEARALVELLPQSAARDALVGLTVKVVDRVK